MSVKVDTRQQRLVLAGFSKFGRRQIKTRENRTMKLTVRFTVFVLFLYYSGYFFLFTRSEIYEETGRTATCLWGMWFRNQVQYRAALFIFFFGGFYAACCFPRKLSSTTTQKQNKNKKGKHAFYRRRVDTFPQQQIAAASRRRGGICVRRVLKWCGELFLSCFQSNLRTRTYLLEATISEITTTTSSACKVPRKRGEPLSFSFFFPCSFLWRSLSSCSRFTKYISLYNEVRLVSSAMSFPLR